MYKWLENKKLPRILAEALKLLGTKEVKGDADNPVILAWAKEIGGWVASFYQHDSIPWCGLFVGLCAQRAGIPFNQKMLGAKNWAEWGSPAPYPMLGDVLVFQREGGGHVGLYVAEDDEAFHVLGGNQGDSVSIMRLSKSRLVSARYGVHDANRRRVFIDAKGKLSENEA